MIRWPDGDETAIRAEMERRVQAWLLKKLQARNCAPRSLRKWRETKGWTQRELDAKCGFKRTVGNIEYGNKASQQAFAVIAQALGAPVWAITEYQQQWGAR